MESLLGQEIEQPDHDFISSTPSDTDTPATPEKKKSATTVKRHPRSAMPTITRRYGISFYEPTYILPFYYTGNPYEFIYENHTPQNQPPLPEEIKAQLSVKFPIWLNLIGTPISIQAYYTQLSYWQAYTNSAYFRETDYEPGIFLAYHFLPYWTWSIGIDHQSNGRGDDLERSWNRAYSDFTFTNDHWYVSLKAWTLIFKNNSSNLHNPDISTYMGYERVVIAFKFYRQELSLMLRNTIESHFSKGAAELDYSFPIHGVLYGYLQIFTGYGQSLIEYNHYTNGFGVGISLSNWL
ncbi:MAG: hypothetical protein A3F41_03445 [Coxiella sp. RIFCSPHIGHO2_12_FULL_44_14]|nr:MAG: hypothetical protein A3F41_03445 [Coxiella sp. RIFCSPHIGHO2_12_FULL_44_14]